MKPVPGVAVVAAAALAETAELSEPVDEAFVLAAEVGVPAAGVASAGSSELVAAVELAEVAGLAGLVAPAVVPSETVETVAVPAGKAGPAVGFAGPAESVAVGVPAVPVLAGFGELAGVAEDVGLVLGTEPEDGRGLLASGPPPVTAVEPELEPELLSLLELEHETGLEAAEVGVLEPESASEPGQELGLVFASEQLPLVPGLTGPG